MLLFKFFCFVLFFLKKTLNLTYQRVEVFIYLFNLSPFCEYHHQLETTRASTSQEYIVLNKNFCKKEGKEAKLCQQNQNPFGLEFRLETNHAIKNFRCQEFKSFQEYKKKKKQAPSQSTQFMFNLFIHNYLLQLLSCIENQRKPKKCSFFAFIIRI